MNKKYIRSGIYFLAILAIIYIRYQSTGKNPPANNDTELSIIDELQSKRLIFTRHAECRMDCRYISEREIKETLEQGHINTYKSDPNDTPCPTYAVESNTADGQTVRIVFANCADVVKVVTAIDLKQNHKCNCK